MGSVTRLGEILQLWQNFLRPLTIFECLFSIWQKFDPTWANLLCYWAIFHCCKCPNIEQII